jgi:hypothetical protein
MLEGLCRFGRRIAFARKPPVKESCFADASMVYQCGVDNLFRANPAVKPLKNIFQTLLRQGNLICEVGLSVLKDILFGFAL